MFTSGGTESNNWVIQTAIAHHRKSKNSTARPHIVTTTVEHDSISLPLKALCQENKIDVSFVPVNPTHGYVTADDIVAAVTPNTCLVTVMMANNETGTIMPVKEISSALRRNLPEKCPLLHTDAAQALGKIEVDVHDLDVDYLTLVGHKFYGPRIGALYVRGLNQHLTPLYPLLFGGGQERNYRPGTENTPMIAGLGKAAIISKIKLHEFASQMKEARDYLESKLLEHFGPGKAKFNCSSFPRLPNTCSVSFIGANLEGYKLLKRIQGFSCSAGSACHSNSVKASPVLMNFHIPCEQAANTLRITTGRSTTIEEIDLVVEELKQIISERI